jgi:hypothetical protein
MYVEALLHVKKSTRQEKTVYEMRRSEMLYSIGVDLQSHWDAVNGCTLSFATFGRNCVSLATLDVTVLH